MELGRRLKVVQIADPSTIPTVITPSRDPAATAQLDRPIIAGSLFRVEAIVCLSRPAKLPVEDEPVTIVAQDTATHLDRLARFPGLEVLDGDRLADLEPLHWGYFFISGGLPAPVC